nr:DCN1-like protein 4 isoform X1 [Ipomoea batatas]
MMMRRNRSDLTAMMSAESASGKAASKELERIDQVFYSYANNLSGVIDLKVLSLSVQIWH